jgi:rfaE bifunctional protein kinase chain/domain
MNGKNLLDIISGFSGKKICVIGDLMVDEYLIGEVSRISPEAPVPVVGIKRRELRPGGAANVALNLASLGIVPYLIGVVGNDGMGRRLADMLSGKGLREDFIVTEEKRITTRKTRVLAENQHITRVDQEELRPVSEATRAEIYRRFEIALKEADAVIIEDYNKGLLSAEIIGDIIEIANAAGKIITVDPKKENFFAYKNVTLFKPNVKEAEEATGKPMQREEELEKHGKELQRKLNCKYLLITRGGSGMSLFTDKVLHVPTLARQVSEVSGAGDTVISALTGALTAGASAEDAAIMANLAAGYVVEQVGIVPITKEILRRRIIEEYGN